jgi:hypothetical protein
MNLEVKFIVIPFKDFASAARWPTQAEQTQADFNHFCGPELNNAAAQRRRVRRIHFPDPPTIGFAGRAVIIIKPHGENEANSCNAKSSFLG